MSTQRNRPGPLLIPPRNKHVEFEQHNVASSGGSLTPDLQPNTPPTLVNNAQISSIGQYLLIDKMEPCGNIQSQRAIHRCTQEEFVCKIIPVDRYRETLTAYWRINSHSHINSIEEILLGETKAYVIFKRSYGDLHSYVRTKKKLREPEASLLFRQIMEAVACCHENGVVLRDLKLRKFVFKDPERTQLKLEGLEDAFVLEDDNDALSDKHGCPAYVSPEILSTSKFYSGRAADVWSAGVMLYTLLAGRYPFHDSEPGVLFSKIRRGAYSLPEGISTRAKCLIRNILRRDPNERLKSSEVLLHPWLRPSDTHTRPQKSHSFRDNDQTVPAFLDNDDVSLFD